MIRFKAIATVNANLPGATPRPFVLCEGTGWTHADNARNPMTFSSRSVAWTVLRAWCPAGLYDKRDQLEVVAA